MGLYRSRKSETQESFGSRSQSAGKPNHDEMGLIQQDRPSSLPRKKHTRAINRECVRLFYRPEVGAAPGVPQLVLKPNTRGRLSFVSSS
ncbi:AT-rich interactive domain-containing protein 1B-like isoform X4 [Clarias magur]|uniref:AT-rich interactive domain-containing protein 1B-like isoform X4 n=1 Tax=Clarias magur TaxID=1594786 RepID=A0A8J4U2U7_CLAMG|nr:AT-rich interactive domain-containing protein 1B-like isoform X4 [Clarias magur]